MKRTQLCLNDEIWQALHIQARQSGTSISELVRQAVRDKYVTGRAGRRQAMQAFVGIWKDRSDLGSAETYLRPLRRGRRHLELGDAWIAATAAIHNLTLWTRNRKHYPMKGLLFY